jgi:hypothetical protein
MHPKSHNKVYILLAFFTLSFLFLSRGASPNSDFAIRYEDLYWVDYSAVDREPYNIDRRDRVAAFEQGQYIAASSEHREPWPIDLPIDWGANPFKDSDWRYQLNAWRLIEPNLQEYEETRDEKYIKAIFPYLQDWYTFNVIEKKINLYKWYDAAAGLRAMKLAYLQLVEKRDKIKYSELENKIIQDLTEEHIEFLTDSANIAQSNHAFFQIHGAMALFRILEENEASRKYIDIARKLFITSLKKQFGLEGMHLEHSPAYHFFVYELVAKFMKTGWYKDIPSVNKLEKKILDNAPWLVDANGSVIEVGDSSPILRNIGMSPLPRGRVDCNNADSYIPKCFGAKLFSEAGYAIARSLPPISAEKSSLIFMTAAYHSKSHRHSDDLSFVWMENGNWILQDTGRYSYGDGKRRLYTRSTRAHNTIEIDSKSYSRHPKYAYGSAIKEATKKQWGFELSGHLWHKDMKAFHARRVLYRPNDWLIVIDRVKNKYESERKWTLWYNFNEMISIRQDGDSIQADLEDDLTLSTKATSTFKNCIIKIVNGQTEPRLQGWRAIKFRSLIPRSSLGYSFKGNEGLIVSVFALSRKEEPKEIGIENKKIGFVVSVKSSNSRWKVRIHSVNETSVIQENLHNQRTK